MLAATYNHWREDMWLRHRFSEEQIETIAQACEDHRASSDYEPRSIYGKIVAEADRFIDPDTIIIRAVRYGLANLRLWFENSPNVARLNALREIIKDESVLHGKFDYLYDSLINLHLFPRY